MTNLLAAKKSTKKLKKSKRSIGKLKQPVDVGPSTEKSGKRARKGSETPSAKAKKKSRTVVSDPDEDDVLTDVTSNKKYNFGKKITEFAASITPTKNKKTTKKDKNKNQTKLSGTHISTPSTKERSVKSVKLNHIAYVQLEL